MEQGKLEQALLEQAQEQAQEQALEQALLEQAQAHPPCASASWTLHHPSYK
jgi:hypothetical protein